MAKIKKAAFAFLAALMLAGIGVMSAGCDNAQEPDGEVTIGTFYSMEQAYEQGFLTQSDLQTIADYHNNPVDRPENLTESVEKSIKETAAYNARNDNVNPIPDAKAENYGVLNYYGEYNGGFAVRLIYSTGDDFALNDVEYEETVAGVKFYYTDDTSFYNGENFKFTNRIMYWKK